MKKTLLTLITFYLVSASGFLPAAESNSGKDLHQENCQSCHDDGVYTRKDRKMTGISSLRTQVQRCVSTLGLQWFEDDVNAVATYLNDTYYQFK